ncbi:ribosome biogenesis GTPase Der [Marinivivus vitaminiproducens]|uniref:ribosome biogenesis GTPase Der n=1 Tax=Marinivivus vitaminiproducens TaxID=3035935 RepID=UPI0027A56EB2|nr:ribosome biogenesis GTPase Der [Geminicoccaceae bacterium SCSIO 64248]
MPPVIAILGRPNVGKSTLFNRLAGRRAAIVDDRPGVTRDRLETAARLGDLDIALVDTAGLEDGPPGSIAARVRRHSEQALAEADLGLLVIDAKAGITPLDETVAAWARRQPKPVLLVANKAEGRAAEAFAAEAWRLGLGEPVALSARTGEGLRDLAEIIRARLRLAEEPEGAEPAAAADEAQEAQDDMTAAAPDAAAEDEAEEVAAPLPPGPLKMVVVGRPNVGKSSLINRLLREERLLTGPEPGLTRDAVSLPWRWNDRPIALIDTAGLRKRARVVEGLERLSTRATVDALKLAHVAVLVVDATQPIEMQDVAIAHLAAREGRALVIVLNKWDLVEDARATLGLVQLRIENKLAPFKGATCLPMSVLTGRGVDRLLPAVAHAYERWNRRVPTARLNQWLEAALAAHPPPLSQGRRIKIRYMTQASTRPPSFVLFGTQVSRLPDAYERYLASGLRESFDLAGTPVRLTLREPDNPFAGRTPQRPVRKGR